MQSKQVFYSKSEIAKDFFRYLIEIKDKYNKNPLTHLMDINARFNSFAPNAGFEESSEKIKGSLYEQELEIDYFWDVKIPIFSCLGNIDDEVLKYLNQFIENESPNSEDLEQFSNISIKKSNEIADISDFMKKSEEFMDLLEYFVQENISNNTLNYIMDAYYNYVDIRSPLPRMEKEKILAKIGMGDADPYHILFTAYGGLLSVFKNSLGSDGVVFEEYQYNQWLERFEQLKIDKGYNVKDQEYYDSAEEPKKEQRIHEISFDDVVGLEEVKDTVYRKLVIPYVNPKLAKELGEHTANLLVLHGPAGTGKTTVSRAISSEMDAKFIELGTIHDKYLGESQKNLDSIVEDARKVMVADKCNVVLYMDEMTQSFDPEREYDRILIDQLKSILSDRGRLKHTTEDGTTVQIYFIGSTNKIQYLDETLCRSERALVLEIPLPTPENRKKLWQKKLEGKNTGQIDYGALARQSEGFSGADIVSIIEEDRYVGGRLKSIIGDKSIHELSTKEIAALNPKDPRMQITQELVENNIEKYKEHKKMAFQAPPEGMFC